MLLTILLRKIAAITPQSISMLSKSFLQLLNTESDRAGVFEKWEGKGTWGARNAGRRKPAWSRIPTVQGPGGHLGASSADGTHSDPTHKDISHFPLRRFKHLYDFLSIPWDLFTSLILFGFYRLDFYQNSFLGGMWYYETRNITINLMSYFLWNRAKGY